MPCQEIILPPVTTNQCDNETPITSMMMDEDFLGKVTHCRHIFLISTAQWSVEEDHAIMGKVAKGKGKTSGKNGKTRKCVEKQDNESTDSFQNGDC